MSNPSIPPPLPPPSHPPSIPPCLSHPCSLSRSLLNRIGENDVNQIKLVFDSIDKNHDGQLSQTELEEFASELG